MRQDNVIAFFILIAFIVYITMKGELRTYLGFFVQGKQTASVAQSNAVPGTSATQPVTALGGGSNAIGSGLTSTTSLITNAWNGAQNLYSGIKGLFGG